MGRLLMRPIDDGLFSPFELDSSSNDEGDNPNGLESEMLGKSKNGMIESVKKSSISVESNGAESKENKC